MSGGVEGSRGAIPVGPSNSVESKSIQLLVSFLIYGRIVSTTSEWAGIREDHCLLGATVMEQLASKIERNEYGVSPYPKTILVHGQWIEGKTLRQVGPPQTPPIVWRKKG
jgi:hypothetical protein